MINIQNLRKHTAQLSKDVEIAPLGDIDISDEQFGEIMRASRFVRLALAKGFLRATQNQEG